MYLDKKLRPKMIGQFFGNESIKAQLKSIKENTPSLILLCGTTGCGKTTLSRIIANKLNYEINEFNISDARGIDAAREIITLTQNTSFSKSGKAIILNEMQGANKFFMNALLERMEEPPSNTIFIICTTEPKILLPAIKSRSLILEVKPLDYETAIKLIERAIKSENLKINEKYFDKIVEVSEGIPRSILIILDSISKLEEDSEIQEALSAYKLIDGEASMQAADLCKALLKKESFKIVMKKFSEIEEQPETIRRIIINYMANVLKSGTMNKNALLILNEFINCNLYLGKPALINSIALLYT